MNQFYETQMCEAITTTPEALGCMVFPLRSKPFLDLRDTDAGRITFGGAQCGSFLGKEFKRHKSKVHRQATC